MAEKDKETLDIASPRPISSDEETESESARSSVATEPHHVSVPDGGRRAWLVVLGGFFNLVTTFGMLNSFGTYQSEYERNLHLSTSTVSWIGSVQMFVLFFSGIFVGPAFDRWGARPLMILGTTCCLVAYIACSFATKFYQLLLAQGFLFGIGCSLLFYPCTSAVSHWFDRRRGLTIGIVVSGGSIGGIIWPIILNQFFLKIGNGWTHRAAALISVPLMLASCLLVRERRDMAGHDAAGNAIKPEQRSFSKNLFDLHFIGLSLALLFVNSGMVVPFFYIPQYAVEHGISPTMANNLLAISYGGSFTGRIVAGWMGDALGRFNMLLVFSAATATFALCFIWTHSLRSLVAISILFGFSTGGIVPLASATVAQITPDMGHVGLRIGAMMAICSAGILSGGPITGAIKDATNDWAGVFITCAAVVMGGSVMLLGVRIFFQRPRTLVF